MIDVKAVKRNLDYLAKQITELAAEIDKAERGEYSPFMDSDEFQLKASEAIKNMGIRRGEFCMIDGPHRCSRCEFLVRHFMAREAKAA